MTHMEPIVYDATLAPRILMRGSEKGFDWVIVARQDFPCSYVRIPAGHRMYQKDFGKIWNDDDYYIKCHGEITWAGPFPDKKLIQPDEVVWWIGWDYGHAGDYNASFPSTGDRKWTIEELTSHVKDVITQLSEMEPLIIRA